MIPSDHFVRFYNEVFKFLDARGALEDYYLEISRDQEKHCLKLFQEKGLQGMAEYWGRIEQEENCDEEMEIFDDHIDFYMHRCPSLSKVTDNDAGAFRRYCSHCPGWIIPLVEKAGFVCEYNIIDHSRPVCTSRFYPKSSGRKSVVLVEDNEPRV